MNDVMKLFLTKKEAGIVSFLFILQSSSNNPLLQPNKAYNLFGPGRRQYSPFTCQCSRPIFFETIFLCTNRSNRPMTMQFWQPHLKRPSQQYTKKNYRPEKTKKIRTVKLNGPPSPRTNFSQLHPWSSLMCEAWENLSSSFLGHSL